MKKILFSIITLLTLTLTSCKLDDTFGLLPSVTGSTFEALLVIEDSTYNSPAGEAVHMLINGPTPILPQPEPLFKVSRVNNSQFDNLLKSTRNIVFVEINPDRYTQAKITFTRDKWANTQAVVNVVAPDNESLKQLIETEGQSIVDFLVLAERNRMLNYLEENTNVEAKNRVNKKFGCNINILTTLNKYEEKQDFFWITNASATIRQDIVIYSTPYTSD